MVDVRPFKGYLPNKELYKSIVSDPYDVVNRDEAMALAAGVPESFFHVNKPEIDVEEAKNNPYCEEVYQKGRENLELFISKGWLQEDDADRMYAYLMEMGAHKQVGIVCLCSVKDYEEDRIKKHEQTMPNKVEDRTKLADTQGANAGPIFMSYTHHPAVQALIDDTLKAPPHFDYTDPKSEVHHCIWKFSVEASQEIQQHFKKDMAKIFIADGHHRANAAYEVGKRRIARAKEAGKEVTGEEGFNYFLSILFSDQHLKCLNYNRVIKSLNDLTPEQFLDKVKQSFKVELAGPAGGFEPKTDGHGHSFMLLEDKWYSLRHEGSEEEAKAGTVVDTLDV